MQVNSTPPSPGKSFLTAEWRDLVMINYKVDPALLRPHVPRGTSLDLWNGRAFISLVAFKFLNTKVLGLPIPWHQNFEEVNLRFYVVREHQEELRRGVVFIREIVPKAAIAWVARMLYNENYVAAPMRHEGAAHPESVRSLSYGWQMHQRWHDIEVTTSARCELPDEDSEASFITEHYWGYVSERSGATIEYRVEHPAWQVDTLSACRVEMDAGQVYGDPWADVMDQPPHSSFIAIGSPVRVRRGVRLADTVARRQRKRD